jgi:phage tail tape-measure protein
LRMQFTRTKPGLGFVDDKESKLKGQPQGPAGRLHGDTMEKTQRMPTRAQMEQELGEALLVRQALGEAVGATVGAEGGAAVGTAVGEAVKVTVGAEVGAAIGTAVGEAVGATVGAEVGAAV